MKQSLFNSAIFRASILLGLAISGCSQFFAPPIEALVDTNDPMTAAADAAFNGDLGFVKSCVDADPRYLEAADGWGKTLLHYAAEGGHQEIVAFLLERGANVYAQDSDDRSPEEVGSQAGAPEEVLTLLRQAMADAPAPQ